ncbi:MAG: 4-hydroxythreonine-4-phosphate dehydrogenase PdxA [Thermodesulfobacteria bacterium]|nr:4-hydroxythreonine-4-phosphate dehydrogenase PdxA [Thermodesulfobacteriota bacterium]
MKVAITLGCPAGIGPEVLIKGLNKLKKKNPSALKELLVIGDNCVIQDREKFLNLKLPKEVEVLSVSSLKISPGHPTIEGYKAMAEYIKKALELAKQKKIKAIVTLPVSKEGLEKANIPYAGHTDWLAKELGAKEYVMCFYSKDIIVSLVTTHIPLKEVPYKISEEKIISVARLSWEFLKKLKKKPEKMAICGLNPHAGEGGLLGTEEIEVISKAVEKCKTFGIPLEGPFPSDSLFYWAYKGRYPLVIALYHDQGLIPFKLLHFEDGVNITLGLPIVRTSPCHGTAYDIADKGIANEESFLSALELALELTRGK